MSFVYHLFFTLVGSTLVCVGLFVLLLVCLWHKWAGNSSVVRAPDS